MISENLGYFNEYGGTIGFYIGKNGITIIDTQFQAQAQHLLNELRKMTEKPFELLINTHHHEDHTNGNIVFAPLVKNFISHRLAKENLIKESQTKGVIPTLPNEVFDETWHKNLGDENLSLYYFGPAHTNGDIIAHFEQHNVVHLADLIFNRRFPFIDKRYGADIENWIRVLDKVNNSFDFDTTFIFGHAANGYGKIGHHEDIKAFKSYLEKLLMFGEQSIQAGIEIKDLIDRTKSIPGSPDWQGEGIERSIVAVYEELLNKK